MPVFLKVSMPPPNRTDLQMIEHKFKLEDFGTRYIQSLLKSVNPTPGTKIRTAWLEYEEGKTVEAQFIREMDKFECMIQAYEYEQRTFGEKDLEEFQGQSSKISSPEGKAWSELLQQERRAHFSKRKRRIPVIFFIGTSCWSHWPQVLTAMQAPPGLARRHNALSYARNLDSSTYS